VSKKTIAFTMPATAPRPLERSPADPEALTGEITPFIVTDEPGGESDDWVRDRDLRHADDRSWAPYLPPAPPAAAGTSVMIDLAAERNLLEAMSLSFFLPFALSWFWFANAMRRGCPSWAG
jgi:hypothetical protein